MIKNIAQDFECYIFPNNFQQLENLIKSDFSSFKYKVLSINTEIYNIRKKLQTFGLNDFSVDLLDKDTVLVMSKDYHKLTTATELTVSPLNSNIVKTLKQHIYIDAVSLLFELNNYIYKHKDKKNIKSYLKKQTMLNNLTKVVSENIMNIKS